MLCQPRYYSIRWGKKIPNLTNSGRFSSTALWPRNPREKETKWTRFICRSDHRQPAERLDQPQGGERAGRGRARGAEAQHRRDRAVKGRAGQFTVCSLRRWQHGAVRGPVWDWLGDACSSIITPLWMSSRRHSVDGPFHRQPLPPAVTGLARQRSHAQTPRIVTQHCALPKFKSIPIVVSYLPLIFERERLQYDPSGSSPPEPRQHHFDQIPHHSQLVRAYRINSEPIEQHDAPVVEWRGTPSGFLFGRMRQLLLPYHRRLGCARRRSEQNYPW